MKARIEALNARLASYVPVAKRIYYGGSDRDSFRVRREGLVLADDGHRFTVRRGDKVVVSQSARRKDSDCDTHDSWIDSVHLDAAHDTVLVHYVFHGTDTCMEPIDEWSAFSLAGASP